MPLPDVSGANARTSVTAIAPPAAASAIDPTNPVSPPAPMIDARSSLAGLEQLRERDGDEPRDRADDDRARRLSAPLLVGPQEVPDLSGDDRVVVGVHRHHTLVARRRRALAQ